MHQTSSSQKTVQAITIIGLLWSIFAAVRLASAEDIVIQTTVTPSPTSTAYVCPYPPSDPRCEWFDTTATPTATSHTLTPTNTATRTSTTIANATLISQGNLYGQQSGGPAIVTIPNLTIGNQYLIVISGIYYWTYDWPADAQWSTVNYSQTCFCTYGATVRFNEVTFGAENGQSSVDPNHEYTFKWTANNTQLQMYIYDSYYVDNSGGMTYKLYEVNGNTPTNTRTATQTPSPTLTGTQPTPTFTNTRTPSPTRTNTRTPSPTITGTQFTPTSTKTRTPSPTRTNTFTPSSTPSPTYTPISGTPTATPPGILLSEGILYGQVNGGPAVVTVSGLTIGREYIVQIEGTYTWTYDWPADAQWSTINHTQTCFCTYGPTVRFNEVPLPAENGQAVADPNHKYLLRWTATSAQLQMYIYDSYYWDNSGGMPYKVFDTQIDSTATPTNTATTTPTPSLTATLPPTATGTQFTPTPTHTGTPPTATPAGTLLAQGILYGQLNGGPAPVTVSGLTIGKQYTIVIQGTFQWTYGWPGDAQWSTFGYSQSCFCNYIPAVKFNGVALAAENGQASVDVNHTYTIRWTATSTQLEMYIYDSSYSDNSGGLPYWVYGNPSYRVYLPIIMRSEPPAANAGYWAGTYEDFFVTPDNKFVDEFSIYVSINGCGNYKITHIVPEPIANKQFAFSGPFYARGIFNSTTFAIGQEGLNQFAISGCGVVTGGPFSWSASWQDGSQPAFVNAQAIKGLQIHPRVLKMQEQLYRVTWLSTDGE